MHRVLAAGNGLRLRLRDAQYLSAHPRLEKGLLRWYGAAHAGMYICMHPITCTVTVYFIASYSIPAFVPCNTDTLELQAMNDVACVWVYICISYNDM